MSSATPIHKRRIERGLTLRALASMCAEQGAPVHWTQLGVIERGKAVPHPPLRLVLARLLDLDIKDFERREAS